MEKEGYDHTAPPMQQQPAPQQMQQQQSPPVPQTQYGTAPVQQRHKDPQAGDMLLYFLALFLPPVSVAIKEHGFTADVCINILLWILGWIPGVLHAWYVIAKSGGTSMF